MDRSANDVEALYERAHRAISNAQSIVARLHGTGGSSVPVLSVNGAVTAVESSGGEVRMNGDATPQGIGNPVSGKDIPRMMIAIREELAMRYPAVAETVPRVRREVAAFATQAGMTADRVDDVRLAVSEAVSNVVRHAYPAGDGIVELTAGVVGDEELWILVADRGVGQQAPSADPGLGFGLGVIARMADELVVAERAEGGTELRMRFGLDGRELPPV